MSFVICPQLMRLLSPPRKMSPKLMKIMSLARKEVQVEQKPPQHWSTMRRSEGFKQQSYKHVCWRWVSFKLLKNYKFALLLLPYQCSCIHRYRKYLLESMLENVSSLGQIPNLQQNNVKMHNLKHFPTPLFKILGFVSIIVICNCCDPFALDYQSPYQCLNTIFVWALYFHIHLHVIMPSFAVAQLCQKLKTSMQPEQTHQIELPLICIIDVHMAS